VQTPVKLTRAQRDLMKQLQETVIVENTPTRHGLFDKVKDIFN
jgi:molecular chaperone DnaJ